MGKHWGAAVRAGALCSTSPDERACPAPLRALCLFQEVRARGSGSCCLGPFSSPSPFSSASVEGKVCWSQVSPGEKAARSSGMWGPVM